MAVIELSTRIVADERSVGWMSRLLGLGKGYKVTTGAEPFGRARILVRNGETKISVLQGPTLVTKNQIQDITPEQAEIISDLIATGLVNELKAQSADVLRARLIN